ncbi:MAG TPA: hypothetical protein G4O00_09710 [Thermoflexia bacterium]|nr:hypothetical protein [Thermoflexia bacterium]
MHNLLEKWSILRENPRLQRWISAGVLFLSVGFLLALLIYGYKELQQFDNWQAYLAACARGFFIYPLSLSLQALTWSMMIARLGPKESRWRDIEIYAYTHLMRRLPGAPWYLAGRAMRYYEQGIETHVTLAASGLEWLLLLVIAMVIYSALSLPLHSSWLASLAFSFLAVVLIAAGFQRLRLRWSTQDETRLPRPLRQVLVNLSSLDPPQWRELALWMGLYAVAYVIGGLILFLLAHSVAPTSGITLGDAVRIWALTGGISFLTSIIIPAGMGIRELTLTALLSPNLPIAGALLVALLLRVLFIASDLVWGGLMWITARILGRDQRDTQHYP